MNGSPLTSGSAVAGVFAAALANGGSLNNVGPGIDFFAQLKKAGNFIPVRTTPQTVASGQTPISIDWDYNNLAYIKEFPAARWGSRSRPTASTAATTPRRSTRPRRTRRRRGSGRSSSTPTRDRSSGSKGFAHPARFNDLAQRKVIPKSLLAALPPPALYAKAKFASIGQQTKAKKQIASEWPSKVG